MNRRYSRLRNNWSRVRRYPFAVPAALLLSTYLLQGCAGTPQAVKGTQDPDVSRILASIETPQEELKTFRGIGNFKILRGGYVKAFRVVWIGSAPDNFRVEALGPWGQPALTLIVTESTYQMRSRQDDGYFAGEATPKNLSRFTLVPVRAEDLFRLLSGKPPVLPFHDAKIQHAPTDGRWILSLYKSWGRLIEKIWIEDDAETVEQVDVFDGWGHLQYRVCFSDFHPSDSLLLPHVMVISDPSGPLWSLTVEKFWTRVSIPEGAYTLEKWDVTGMDLNS